MPGAWSLADVYMDCPLDNEAANAQFQGDGVFVMIRFGENLFRVASNKPNVLERTPSGSIIRKVVWQSDFTVSHRLIETYNIGRVFLAGDSAHIHSPLGGRGMNMGIEDATILARKIVYGGLELYSEERHKVGASAIRMIRKMTQMATSTSLTARIIRNYILPTILNLEFIEQPILRRMVGIG